MTSADIDTLMSVLERGTVDILIYDGKFGPSVIRPLEGDDFAVCYGVESDSSRDGEDIKLSRGSRLSRDETRSYIEEAFRNDIEVEREPKSSSEKHWVFNMF